MARHINEFGLTEQQEKFCLAYMGEAEGCASEAYRLAYPTSRGWKDNALNVEASRMLSNPKVDLRVKQLRRNAAGHATLNLVRAKEILSELAEAVADSPELIHKLGPVKIKAIERLAKMEQWDAPEQIQVEQVQFHLNLGGQTDDDDDSDPDEIIIPAVQQEPAAAISGPSSPTQEDLPL